VGHADTRAASWPCPTSRCVVGEATDLAVAQAVIDEREETTRRCDASCGSRRRNCASSGSRASTFNLVRDLNAGTFNTVDYRIVDINLDSVTIDTDNPALSVRLVFRHSGESDIPRNGMTGARALLLPRRTGR
jgi:hypothetical protein